MAKNENSSRNNSQTSRNNSQALTIQKIVEDRTDYDRSIKVILLGDSNVGKSSIIDRLKTDTFNINQRSTISLEHHNIILKLNNYILRLQFWDTAGQEKFDSIVSTYYKSTDVVFLVYAINIRESFERISEWEKRVEENDKDEEQIKILIGNKSDLEVERKVSFQEGQDLANKLGCNKFFEISCMNKENNENNKNIKSIIDFLGQKYYNIIKANKSERLNSSSYNYIASESILMPNKKSKKCAC